MTNEPSLRHKRLPRWLLMGMALASVVALGYAGSNDGVSEYPFLTDGGGIHLPPGEKEKADPCYWPGDRYQFVSDPMKVYRAGKRALLADGWTVEEDLERGSSTFFRGEMELAVFSLPRWIEKDLRVRNASCEWTIRRQRGWMRVIQRGQKMLP